MKAVSKPKPMKSDGTWGAPDGAEGDMERLVPFAAAEHVGYALPEVVFVLDAVLVDLHVEIEEGEGEEE